MISRVWHGWTAPANADAYERLLRETVLPGIERQGIREYRGAWLYRRTLPSRVEFVTTLLFDSLDAVREFAGEDHEVAVLHPEAHALLAEYDERSAHYDVLLHPDASAEAR